MGSMLLGHLLSGHGEKVGTEFIWQACRHGCGGEKRKAEKSRQAAEHRGQSRKGGSNKWQVT